MVEDNAGRIALEDGSSTLTHRQLEERVTRFTARLVGLGTAEGEVAAVLLPNGSDYVLTTLAVARAGAILCPLNTRYRRANLLRS